MVWCSLVRGRISEKEESAIFSLFLYVLLRFFLCEIFQNYATKQRHFARAFEIHGR